MTVPELAFHLFARLPAELRLKIWRLCLPQRVYELDQPVDGIVFGLSDKSSRSPCRLYQTTYENGRPPLISRVCRESRAIATKSGGFITICDPSRPLDTQWISGTDNSDSWIDAARDSPHLNWTSEYEADYDCSGDSLQCLVWEALHSSGPPSLMLTYLDPTAREPHASRPGPQIAPVPPISMPKTPDEIRMIDAYKRLSTWLVVMHVIVVHLDIHSAAATGLFGLLGDAPVQIIPASDEVRLNRLYNLAEQGERGQPITVAQDLARPSADMMRRHLRCVVMSKLRCEELTKIMHPAIMFRLCTHRCNHRAEKDG